MTITAAAPTTDTVPDDTVPDDTAPNDTAPNDTVPNDTAPNDTASVGTAVEPAAPTTNVEIDGSVAADTGVGTTTGGLSFDFTIGGKTYTAIFTTLDANGQRGFMVTQAGVDVASFIYKDAMDWAVTAGLPAAVKIDDNFTINTFTLDVKHGTTQALS